MNALILRRIGYYILGGSIGAGIGYLIADYIEARTIEISGKQLEFDWEKVEDPEVKEALEYITEDKTSNEVMAVPPGEIKEKKVKKGTKVPQIDYSHISTKRLATKPKLADVVKERLGEEAVNEPDESNSGKPYIISLDQYANGDNRRAKVTLTYYEDDDTLADQNEEVIAAVEQTIGPDALVNFGQGSNDPDSVYIRDDNTFTDYEVVRLHKKYTETVLGIIEKKEEKKKNGKTTTRGARSTRKVTKIDDEDEGDDEE